MNDLVFFEWQFPLFAIVFGSEKIGTKKQFESIGVI
jgi:hypothetical protein